MIAEAFIVCLRLGAGFPDLYALWFENENGRNSLVSKESRIYWTQTRHLAGRLVDETSTFTLSDDAPVFYDVLDTINDLRQLRVGAEMRVLNFFNFLDDLVLQIGLEVPEDDNATMVGVVTSLTEGKTLGQLCASLGGSSPVLDLLYGHLGRVLAHSTVEAVSDDSDRS